MKTIVTDVDVERSCGGQYFTIYIKQGKLAGNMLLPQEGIADKEKGIIEAAQDYIDKHEADSRIRTVDDVLTYLEADCQKFPALRDSVEYHRPDEYSHGREPLIHCYTSITRLFTNNEA